MKYTSKSLSHIYSYKQVSQAAHYALSWSVVAFVYTQLVAVLTPLVDTVAAYPLIINNVQAVDDGFDALVLQRADSAYAGVYAFVRGKLDRANSGAAAINSAYLNYVNTYLPSSKELKLSGSELSKFYTISNESVTRARSAVVSNSNSLSNHLISTYNAAFESDKSSGYTKRVNVAVSTVRRLLDELNSNYVTPFKNQTQDYVHDVATHTKNKADSFISEARQGIPSFIKGTAPVEDGPAPVVAASPAVSASA